MLSSSEELVEKIPLPNCLQWDERKEDGFSTRKFSTAERIHHSLSNAQPGVTVEIFPVTVGLSVPLLQ